MSGDSKTQQINAVNFSLSTAYIQYKTSELKCDKAYMVKYN